MHKNRLHLISSAILVTLAAGCQQAGPSQGSAAAETSLQARFERLDANHDGYITWEEAMPSREAEFRKMDKSGDGRVLPAEYTGRLPFGSFDTNSDGAIVVSEFLATHRGMFLKFDENRDGRISPPEFAQAQQAAEK